MIRFWIKEATGLFRFYKVRFIFGLVGIVLGIAAVCALVSVRYCVDQNSQQLLKKYGESRFVVTLVPSGKPFSYQNIVNFSRELLPEFIVMPYQILSINAFYHFKKMDSMIVASVAELFSTMQWKIAKGSIFSSTPNNKAVVIGQNIALGKQIGETISLEGSYYEIIGILEKTDFNPLLDFDPNQTIFVDIGLIPRLQGRQTIDSFIVQTSSNNLPLQEKKFTDIIENKLPKASLFYKDAYVFQKAFLQQVVMTVKVLGMVAVITLVLGGVSILNLLMVLINERRKEIGIRLAFGATPLTIGTQFLRETLMLCTAGGIGGMILGNLGAIILVKQLGITYYFAIGSWIIGLPVALGIGTLVGIVPAILAAKLDPAKLLN